MNQASQKHPLCCASLVRAISDSTKNSAGSLFLEYQPSAKIHSNWSSFLGDIHENVFYDHYNQILHTLTASIKDQKLHLYQSFSVWLLHGKQVMVAGCMHLLSNQIISLVTLLSQPDRCPALAFVAVIAQHAHTMYMGADRHEQQATLVPSWKRQKCKYYHSLSEQTIIHTSSNLS